MKRRVFQLGGIALISLLAGAAVFHLLNPADRSTTPARNDADIELHSIPLSDLDGTETRLADWGGPVLIVNFWAPWCAPCRREIPALIQIQREYAERGVTVLGIAFDGEAPVRRFAAEYAIDYPLFLATNRGPMYNAAFDNPSGSLPFTALLDREHKIRFRHSGEVTTQLLREQLDAHL